MEETSAQFVHKLETVFQAALAHANRDDGLPLTVSYEKGTASSLKMRASAEHLEAALHTAEAGVCVELEHISKP